MRNHEPIEVAVPSGRRVLGCVVFLLGLIVLLGWLPFGPVVLGVALLLIATGLLV